MMRLITPSERGRARSATTLSLHCHLTALRHHTVTTLRMGLPAPDGASHAST
ncbi:MAG: hypothetical protein IKW93_03080 [Bacteroidales bacterium]|nr:hypothetical protein [Bacteroidales bacterium]